MAFGADALGAWLVETLADAGRKRLTTLVLGTDQERALRAAATAAVQLTSEELEAGDKERAEQLALVIREVFGTPVPRVPLAEETTILEALQAGIVLQLAVLDDTSLTGVGQSSADVLGVPGTVVATKLTGHLLQEILTRGSRGGPLFPLASQLNDDATHRQGQRIEDILGLLTAEVRGALARLDGMYGRGTVHDDEMTALTKHHSRRSLSLPTQLTQRTVPLSDGLRAGMLLAIEVQAHRELEEVAVLMTGIIGPPHAVSIPPPARLYWHPSRQISTTIAQSASGLINVARTGPLPPGAIMETPDQEFPWTLLDGQWRVELQLTAMSFPALHLTATFNVTPANGFPIQRLDWLALTAS